MHVSLKSFKAKLQTQIFSKEKGVTIIDLLPIIISASFKCAPGATVVAVDKNNYRLIYCPANSSSQVAGQFPYTKLTCMFTQAGNLQKAQAVVRACQQVSGDVYYI